MTAGAVRSNSKPGPRAYVLTDVLTTREVARWLRKSERTVQRLRLPQVLAGRYLFADVLEALKARRQVA
jgi:hypothetical protein